MNKFLVFGSNSRLATHFIDKYKDYAIPISHTACDITNVSDLKKVFGKYEFEYILNCAAITNIEYCEKNPIKTFKVNFLGPKNIKTLTKKFGKKLILISSNHAVSPINIYGKSKKKMETLADKDTLVIRTDFYDMQNYILKNILSKKPIMCYENAYFSPVSVNRLVKEIFSNRDKNEILNIFGSPCLSFYNFGLLAEKELNGSQNLVLKGKAENPLRPLNGCIKSDISIDIKRDLKEYANNLKK